MKMLRGKVVLQKSFASHFLLSLSHSREAHQILCHTTFTTRAAQDLPTSTSHDHYITHKSLSYDELRAYICSSSNLSFTSGSSKDVVTPFRIQGQNDAWRTLQ
jgi:hypothetical protein